MRSGSRSRPAVLHPPPEGHGAPLHREAAPPQGGRLLRLRRLRTEALRLQDQVRLVRMALVLGHHARQVRQASRPGSDLHPSAAATSATSSTTARRPPASATESIPSRSSLWSGRKPRPARPPGSPGFPLSLHSRFLILSYVHRPLPGPLPSVRPPHPPHGRAQRHARHFLRRRPMARPRRAVRHARAMAKAGADLVDVGGESTRPGAAAVGAARSSAARPRRRGALGRGPGRLDRHLQGRRGRGRVPGRGADPQRRDGARRPRAARAAADAGAAVVLMHMKGTPRTMQRAPRYRDVVGDLLGFFPGTVWISR